MKLPGESSPTLLMARRGMQRVPSAQLELFILRDFLGADECHALIERIEADRRPSTLANFNGDAAFRTSETCDLFAADPFIAGIVAKLDEISGIAPENGEVLQGQRYETGQEFKLHSDCFEPSSADYDQYCAQSGQRTWTFMVFLNDVTAGGATRFKEIGKTVRPERGKLLAWNNRLPDGRPNPATKHQAMKVRSGMKYVITRWYRERPHQ